MYNVQSHGKKQHEHMRDHTILPDACRMAIYVKIAPENYISNTV